MRYILGLIALTGALLISTCGAGPSQGFGAGSGQGRGVGPSGYTLPNPVYSHFPSMGSGDGSGNDDYTTAGSLPTTATGLYDNLHISTGTAIDTYSAAPYNSPTGSHIWFYTFPARANPNQSGLNCNYFMAITGFTNCAGTLGPGSTNGNPLIAQQDTACTSAVVSGSQNLVNEANANIPHIWWTNYIGNGGTVPVTNMTAARLPKIYGVFVDGNQVYDIVTAPCGYQLQQANGLYQTNIALNGSPATGDTITVTLNGTPLAAITPPPSPTTTTYAAAVASAIAAVSGFGTTTNNANLVGYPTPGPTPQTNIVTVQNPASFTIGVTYAPGGTGHVSAVAWGPSGQQAYQSQVAVPFLNSLINTEMTNGDGMANYALMANGFGGSQLYVNGTDAPSDAIFLLSASNLGFFRVEDFGSKKTVSGTPETTALQVSQSGYGNGNWLEKEDDLLYNTQVAHKVMVAQVHMGEQDPGDTGALSSPVGTDSTGGVAARYYTFASFLLGAQPQYDILWDITCYNYGGPNTFPGTHVSNCGGNNASRNKTQTFPELGITCYTPINWGSDNPNVSFPTTTTAHVGQWPIDVGAPGSGNGLNVPGITGETTSRVYAMEYASCYQYTYSGQGAQRLGRTMVIVNTDPVNTATIPTTGWIAHYSNTNCPACKTMSLSSGTDVTIDGGGTATFSTGLQQLTLPPPLTATASPVAFAAQITSDPNN